MKLTDVRTAVVEVNYDRTFTDEKVTRLEESFLAPGLSQGEIYHGC